MSKYKISLVRLGQGFAQGLNISLSPPASCPFYITPDESQVPEGLSYKDGFLTHETGKVQILFPTEHWSWPLKTGQGYWISVSQRDNGHLAFGCGEQLLGYVPACDEGQLLWEMDFNFPKESRDSGVSWSPRPAACYHLRSKLKIEDHKRNEISFDDFSAEDGLFLAYLRMSFPDAYFELAQLPSEKNLKPLWKRYCQNLGIRCGKAPRIQGELSPVKRLDEGFFENKQTLLYDINKSASIIPERLLKLWLSTS